MVGVKCDCSGRWMTPSRMPTSAVPARMRLPGPTCARSVPSSATGYFQGNPVPAVEDRSQMRCGAIPQTFAACRNLAIGLLRTSGAASIAAALRTYAARPVDAALLVLSTGRLR